MIDPILLGKARRLIARLELVSHGRSMSWDPSRGGEGALFPPGGVNRDDDRDPDSLILRSHLHYRRRLAGVRSDETLRLLIDEMERMLKAWTHSPLPPRDSLAWRTEIANAEGNAAEVARRYGITREHVWVLRKRLRRAA